MLFCALAALREMIVTVEQGAVILKIKEESDALCGCALIVELSALFHPGPICICKSCGAEEIVPCTDADLITLCGTVIHLAAEFQIERAVQFQRSEQRKISSICTKLKKELSISAGIDEE